MRQSFLTAIWLLLMVGSAWAQSRTVTGKVTDKNGVPLPGVSVTIKNSSTGTQTNDDGTFSITVPNAARTLLLSFVGYNPQEVSIGRGNTLNVTLLNEEKKLDEVVVVAYGTQRKREVTGSVAVIDEKTIRRQQVTSVGQALQGTAAGVMVVNNSGQPGDNPQIRIRGIASLNASAEPFTAQYYKHLIELLASFLDMVNEYDANGQELLLGNLNACYSNEPSFAVNQSVDSEEVATMHKIIEDYIYQVGEYYQYFHLLLQKEQEQENDKSKVLVMSHVAYYLDTLITCTEKMIINMEITLDMLLEWETALQNRESQELFN